MPITDFIMQPLDGKTIVRRLESDAALSLPLLDIDYCAWLVRQAQQMSWRDARPLVGKPPNEVLQRMEVCEHFPSDSIFRDLVSAFQALCERAFFDCDPYPFESPLVFNDLMLQRYSVGEIGITPHRDRTDYRNLIVLFVLAGIGRFRICADRSGVDAVEIANRSGDVILTQAPGFLHCHRRPFHAMDRILEPRYVFGLRYDRSKR